MQAIQESFCLALTDILKNLVSKPSNLGSNTLHLWSDTLGQELHLIPSPLHLSEDHRGLEMGCLLGLSQ